MKKITLIALFISFFNSAFAQESEERKNNSAAHKSEIIASMNKEKSIIDAAISCVGAANKKEDMEKCHDQKKSSMDALRKERDAAHQQRKEKLQNEMKKIDENAAKRGARRNGN